TPKTVVITVVSASIDGHRSDGSAWDEGPAPVPPPHVRGVIERWLAAHPELDGTDATIGEPIETPGVLASAGQTPAPDPYVLLEGGKSVYRTTLAPGQFQPVWRFPLVATINPGDAVQITVLDWDGLESFDVIGYTIVPGQKLIDAPTLELGRFGNVDRLIIE